MIPKLDCFQYFVSKLMEWHKSVIGSVDNDLSKIKVLKLLFFVSAVEADMSNDGLLNIFNRFYAMPYGPVESDIYNSLEDLDYCRIDKKMTRIIGELPHLDAATKEQIDSSLNKLKKMNPELIRLKPFDLVDLSHKWSCWSLVYKYALKNKSYSEEIPKELIKAENKVFTLNEMPYEF